MKIQGYPRVSSHCRFLWREALWERGGCWIPTMVSNIMTTKIRQSASVLVCSFASFLTQRFILGELTASGPYLMRPFEEVPEDEEWRSSRPVPAVAYFDGLCQDLISLQMIPLPHPSDHWMIWEARDDKIYASDTFMSWAKVSLHDSTIHFVSPHLPSLVVFSPNVYETGWINATPGS